MRFSEQCDELREKSTTLEFARVLVRFDHVASVIVNADHGIM
jgi:hypothetical protein